jgi:predicted DNA-binding transcriptional regulator YafY
MTRTERLLELLENLRARKYAVTAEALAVDLGVSVRTVYRDIGTLQGQGAAIEGEAGVGYVLKPGFTLPPLMFDTEELEALVLGLSWVSDRADRSLVKAATRLGAKIKAVLPATLREQFDSTTLIVGPADRPAVADDELVAVVRRALREERRLTIDYENDAGQASHRTIWPFGLGYFDHIQIVMAWCELRRDLRHFRTDRIRTWTLGTGYPEPRRVLLAKWREREGIRD